MISIDMNIPEEALVFLEISPMLEVAGGLHMITQRFVHFLHHPEYVEMIQLMKHEHLFDELLYFTPLFVDQIPLLFTPILTYGIQELEEQFEYVTTLPLRTFMHSFEQNMRIYKKRRPSHMAPIEQDYNDDPELLFHRFTLFLTSYLRLIFHSTWNNQYPILTTMQQQLLTHFHSAREHLGHFLLSMFPSARNGDRIGTILLPENRIKGVELTRNSLHLYISWYLRHPVYTYRPETFRQPPLLLMAFPSLMFRQSY